MVLRRYFDHQSAGFYLDVGAHHPKRFSNTHYFYRRGWRGMNIDAMPGAMRQFRRWRRHDVNLEVAIGSTERELRYYMFEEPALNGFQSEMMEMRLRSPGVKLKNSVRIPVRTLASVLRENLPHGQEIDFLTIDVEGLDYDVLISNDWAVYRPRLIVVEIIGSSLDDVPMHPVSVLLQTNGYRPFAKCFHSVFFERVVQVSQASGDIRSASAVP